MADHTVTELMAVTAAREIRDGEIVFAGTGLAMLRVMLAQRTHAPNCCIIFQAGTAASQLAHLPMSVGDPRNMRGAALAAGSMRSSRMSSRGKGRRRIPERCPGRSLWEHQQHFHWRRFPPSPSALLRQRRGMRHRLPGPAHDHHGPAREGALPREGGLHHQPRLAGRGRQPAEGGPDSRRSRRRRDHQRGHTLPAREQGHLPCELPPRPDRSGVAEDAGFSLDIEGANETPAPTSEEIRILREVVDPERIFLK